MAATSTAALYTTSNTASVPVSATTTAERPKLTLRTTTTFPVNGTNVPLVYVFEVSPNEISLQRLTLAYGELERPGRKPLLQPRGAQLQQVSGTVLITARGDGKFFSSCQAQIDGLVTLSQINSNILISYPGVPATTVWRISDLSIRTVRRNEDNEVTIGEADITFTEAVVVAAVVPGMPVIKDVPASRTPTTTGGSTGGSTGGTGTTTCQRAITLGLTGRDAETACAVQTVIDAGG